MAFITRALITILLLSMAQNGITQNSTREKTTRTATVKRNVTSVFSPEANWKFNTYAALFIDNVIAKQHFTASIGTYVSTVEEEANQSDVDAVIAGFAGVSGQMRNGQRLGMAIGTGFGILSLRPKLLCDLTLSFGPDQRFIVLAGISIGQIEGLSSSVYQNEWGMVYSHQENSITEVPMSRQAKLGFSLGLGWQLGK